MPDLPSGTVTFLFTDIAGRTERKVKKRDRHNGKQRNRRKASPLAGV